MFTQDQINAAAIALAECMDYPWAYMPEEGRNNMRRNALLVLNAANLTKLKDDCFEAGWIAASQWADREDLVHDIGSPAYLMTKNKALK